MVESAHQTILLTVFLTNLTEPSAIVTFTPPGWLLVAETDHDESVLLPTLPLTLPGPVREPLKIDSFGVWTELNIVAPGMPMIQR